MQVSKGRKRENPRMGRGGGGGGVEREAGHTQTELEPTEREMMT